jgi:hypothetical protein
MTSVAQMSEHNDIRVTSKRAGSVKSLKCLRKRNMCECGELGKANSLLIDGGS